jgi:hypothetical protein
VTSAGRGTSSADALQKVQEETTKLIIGSLVDRFNSLVSTLDVVSAKLAEKEDENLKLK